MKGETQKSLNGLNKERLVCDMHSDYGANLTMGRMGNSGFGGRMIWEELEGPVVQGM